MRIAVKTAFDARAIETMAVKACRKALKASGAYIRKAAMASIRRTKGRPSAAGTPPHTRKGRLKKAILFGLDHAGISVAVGAAAGIISKVGHYHEYGGREQKPYTMPDFRIGGTGPVRIGKDGNPVYAKLKNMRMVQNSRRVFAMLYGGKTRVHNYPARPFMGPALKRSLPRLKGFWADVIRK